MTSRQEKAQQKKEKKQAGTQPKSFNIDKGVQARGSTLLSESADSVNNQNHLQQDQMLGNMMDLHAQQQQIGRKVLNQKSKEVRTATINDYSLDEQEKYKLNNMSVQLDTDSRGQRFAAVASHQMSVQQNINNSRQMIQANRQLSSSIGTGSIDRGTPWLLPVSSIGKSDTPEVGQQAQQLSQKIEEPKIIDILVNDQERIVAPYQSDKSDLNSCRYVKTENSVRGGGTHKNSSTMAPDQKQAPAPSLALQIQSIKDTLQSVNSQQSALPKQTSSSRQQQKSTAGKAGNGPAMIKTQQYPQQNTNTTFSQSQKGSAFRMSHGQQQLQNAANGLMNSLIITSPRQQQLQDERQSRQFLETDRFLQISQKKVLVNQDAQQLRDKQRQSAHYQQKRKNDLLSCMTQERIVLTKNAAGGTDRRTAQQAQEEENTTQPNIETQSRPQSTSRNNDANDSMMPDSNKNISAAIKSGQALTQAKSAPRGATKRMSDRKANQFLKNPSHVEGDGFLKNTALGPDDLVQLDAAVTIPDVYIRKRVGGGAMTTKHGAMHQEHRGMMSLGNSSGKFTSSHVHTGPMSPRQQFDQIRSSMSDATNSASSSLQSRTPYLQNENQQRIQPTLQLNMLSERDVQDSAFAQTMIHRTNKNPVKINRFIEKFGGGAADKIDNSGSTSQDLTNFFSARENMGRIKTTETTPSARPKTSDRGPATGRSNVAKSFEMLNPKKQSSVGPTNINLKRRYTAERGRRAQIMSIKNQNNNKDLSQTNTSTMQPQKQAHFSRIAVRNTKDLPKVAQSLSQQQQELSQDGKTTNDDTTVVGIFQEKPTLKLDPSVFSSQRGKSTPNTAMKNNAQQFSRKTVMATTQSLQNASMTMRHQKLDRFREKDHKSRRDEAKNQTLSWDQLRAQDRNIIPNSFCAQDPSYRRIENLRTHTKQPQPRSFVRVPELLKSNPDSLAATNMASSDGQQQNQLLSSCAFTNQLVESKETVDKVRIQVMDFQHPNHLLHSRDDFVNIGDSRGQPSQGEDDKQTLQVDQSMKKSGRGKLVSTENSHQKTNESVDNAETGSNHVVFQVVKSEFKNTTEASPRPSKEQGRHNESPIRRDSSITESSVCKSENYLAQKQREQQRDRLAAMQKDFAWEKGDQLESHPYVDESPSVSKLSSVSMRVDSKMSLQAAMAEEHKKSLAQNKEKQHKTQRHVRELQCRVDGAFLPLSVDLLPSNNIEKAIHKINNRHQFDKVVKIGIRDTNEQNFISQLHGIEVAKIDQMLEKEREASMKPTEDTSKTDEGVPSSLTGKSAELKEENLQESKQLTQQVTDTALSLSEASEAQVAEKVPVNVWIPEHARIKVKNPQFELTDRPASLDILYQDVIRVFNSDENLDIFMYKSEDYLDDIRLLKEHESVSLDVRIAHDLINKWVHYIRPPPPPPPKKKRKKQFKQNKAHASMITIEELSMNQSSLKKSMIGKSSGLGSYSAELSSEYSKQTNSQQQIAYEFISAGFASSKVVSGAAKPVGTDEAIMSELRATRHPQVSIDSSKDSLLQTQTYQDLKDLSKRRVLLNLYESQSLCKVAVKLEVDFEAILKLQRKIADYSEKRLQNVLPLYIFDDFESECQVIQKEIYRRRTENLEPVACIFTMKDEFEKRVQDVGEVLDYDRQAQMFIIQVDEKRYFMHRLCVQFEEYETKTQIEDRRVAAMQMSKSVLLRNNIERILFHEILKMRPELCQSAQITNNIEKKADLVRLSRVTGKKVDNDRLKEIVKQFHSVYCYSMLKSIVMSETEEEDPKFACMITGYKVEKYKTHETPYFGLQAYELNKGPIDHLISKKDCKDYLQSYSLLGRLCFQQAFKFVTTQTLDLLDQQPLFQIPISEATAFSLIIKPQFKQKFKSTERIINETQNYPLKTLDFALLQHEISKNFNQVVVNKWQDSIVRHVRKIILDNFKGAKASLLTKDVGKINPFIIRFLKSIYQMQVNHLFKKYEDELRSYLEFLLRFANLSPEFLCKQGYLDYGLDKIQVDYSDKSLILAEVQIEVISQSKDTFTSQHGANDLLKKNQNPFKVVMRKLRPQHANQKLITSPPLEDIYKEMYKILNGISVQFMNIPTVHASIYKFANIGRKTFQVSADLGDRYFEQDSILDGQDGFRSVLEGMSQEVSLMSIKELASKDSVYRYRKQIEYVMNDIVEQVNSQLVDLRPFIKFIGYKFEDLVFDLKSMLFQNQMDMKMQNEEDDFNAMLTYENAETMKEDYLLEMVNKTQITDQTYQYQYKELQDAYWKVQKEVQDWYNFGIIRLDCRTFKKQAIDGLNQLLTDFQEHLLEEFLRLCNDHTNKNTETWGKVKAVHVDIDATIEQIDYINVMRQEEVYDEMISFVRFLGVKKKFLDQLQVSIPDADFKKFLNLHSFPTKLKQELSVKSKILRNEQKKISRLITIHSSETKNQLNQFSKKFRTFREIGLPTRKEFMANINDKNKSYIYGTLDKMAQDGFGKNEEDVIWDSAMIEEQTQKIAVLNDALAQVEEDTKTINKRQEALQMKITDFPELYNLKQEIKPYVQLWETIAQYHTMIEDWKEKPIQKMTLEEIEDFCNEWYRKLLFVMRNSSLIKWPGPKGFCNHIMAEIEHIREFLPLLTCLKVKGLERRHISQINRDIQENLQLNKINFRWLVKKKDLHKGKKFDTIKAITDSASKEFAIKLTIEAVEYEVEGTKMTAIKYKDSMILKNLPRDMANFTECDLKITSIAHNSFARFFKERIERLQKDLKRITYFFSVWNDLQKYWAYLLPIFAQRDIAHHMPEQYEKFVAIDRIYREEINNTESRCKTYKQFCKRESLRQNVPLMMQMFEYLMKCLIKYLEAKREYFPRLFFLSNEQIIEIVGMMEDISGLEMNLFKMFEGIDKLVIVYDDQTQPSDNLDINTINTAREASPDRSKKVWRAQDTRLFKQGLATCLGTRPVREIGQDLGSILGVCNQQGELLEFNQPVKITEQLEYWLKRVEYSMKFNVSRTLQQAYHSFSKLEFLEWIKLWPTQFLLVVLEINLTNQLKEIFEEEIVAKSPTRLGKVHNNIFRNQNSPNAKTITATPDKESPAQKFKKHLNDLQYQITQLTLMIREQLTNSVRQCINTLIINRVHSRDIIKNMLSSGIEKSSDFLWNIHMRYDFKEQVNVDVEDARLENSRLNEERRPMLSPKPSLKSQTSRISYTLKEKPEQVSSLEKAREYQAEKDALHLLGLQFYPTTLCLQMVEAEQPYGYEFLANTARLVISPLTERCFQSLFLALHFKYGGAPIGPAGTGKTESIKEMGKNIARHCFIFNCQSQIDYMSMSKFFKGLAANGTWVCFDEFNRLEIHVLSIISQLIVSLTRAKHDESAMIEIEGTILPFNQNCGLFITMNPFNFGRTPLPDNLKALFRQITMVVPDTLFIAEILLYGVGFNSARNLAFKITHTFGLINEHLRFEQHYDFGLRTIKSVLIYAGEVKLRCMKVKTRADIESGNSDAKLTNHLDQIKKLQIKKKKNPGKKISSGAALRKNLLANIRNQGSVDASQGQPTKVVTVAESGAANSVPSEVALSQPEDFDSSCDSEQRSKVKNSTTIPINTGTTEPDLENEIITEEDSSISDSESGSGSSVGSSTEEKMKKITKMNKKKEDQSESDDVIEEIAAREESDNSEDESDSTDNNRIEEMGLDRDYLINQLGCDSKKVLMDEDLLDQFIVLKAIIDKNLPKLLFRDISILQNIVSDVFPNIPMSQYGSLKNEFMDMIDQRLDRRQLYRGSDFIQNIYNIYEAMNSRHGIMVVGRPASGKTTSIKMLQDVLNVLHQRELNDSLKKFQKEKAVRLGIQTKTMKGQIVPKDNDPQIEMHFTLTEQEKQLIIDTCVYKGITNFTLNPKSVSINQLMGQFDETSREWTDGVLSHGIRQATMENTGRRMLVTCDGPIEPDWVENMNSVLDDNKRLSLITGETLYLTPTMNILLETSQLDDCTPATISRCAICYIRRETLPAKAQFNHWLQSLPKILRDQQERLDLYANYFITDIFINFMVPEKMLYPMTQTWTIMTFIRIFDSLIFQYRNEKYNDQRCLKKVTAKIYRDTMEAEDKKKRDLQSRVQKQESMRRRIETTKRLHHLERTATISGSQMQNMKSKLVRDSDDSSPDSLSLGSNPVISEEDLDADQCSSEDEGSRKEDNASSLQSKRSKAALSVRPDNDNNSSFSGSARGSARGSERGSQTSKRQARITPKHTRTKFQRQSTQNFCTTGDAALVVMQKEQKIRPPEHTYYDNDLTFECSIKNKNYWIDCFFLYSLVWAFGSILNDQGRKEFNTWLQSQLKQKDQTRKEAAEALEKENQASKTPTDSEEKSASDFADTETVSQGSEVPYLPTQDFVIGQVDHMEASIPSNMNVFDAFFDVQSGLFQNWRSVYNYNQEEKSVERPKKNLLAVAVTTQDYLRIDFLFDRLLEIKKPIMLLGPTSQGKSTFMRNYCFENDNPHNKISYDLLGCSVSTNSQKLLSMLEAKLVKQTKIIMQPPDDTHQVYFIDDIHMVARDRWNDQSANEMIRQHLDFGGWFNLDKIFFKKVKDINFVSSISTRVQDKEVINERLGWHFAGIGVLNFEGCHIEQIYKYILSKAFVHSNSSAVQGAAPFMVQSASLEFFKQYQNNLKPSPTQFLFKVNTRHLLYILKGLLDVPNNYFRTIDNVALVWVNEICRTVIDRYTDPQEQEKIYETVRNIACSAFKVRNKIFPRDFRVNQFFYGQPESEAHYNEIVDEKKLTILMHETMEAYNKANPQEPISVIIFNSIIEKTLKINRSIQIPFANTILIADQGSGANELCKMAIKLARASDNQLFANDSEQLEDWRGHIRSIIQRVGLETKSRAVLHLIERDFIEGVLDTINGLAAHGELFQLFNTEELEAMLNQVRYKTFSTNLRGKERTESQTLEEIREQIHQNLHMLLQLTPRSKVLLTGLRDAAHLLNSSTLIYFGEWSDSGYQYIAKKHLTEASDDSMPLQLQNTEQLSKVMIEMYHDTVKSSQLYYQETDHYVYISPQQFEMFVQTFKRLFYRRSIKLHKHRQRFRVGLDGIKRTQVYTENKQDELSKKSPELVEKQRGLERLIDELDVQKGQISKQIQLVLQIEDDTVYWLNECKMVQKECDKRMQEATPVFKSAVEGLLQITKKEVDELRTIMRPLQTIRQLLTAVCLILQVEPTTISNKETNYKPFQCYWKSAISTKLLGDRNIIHRMTQIDPTQIEPDTMRKLEELIDTGEINAAKVQKATFATRGIFSWVMAVRNYFYVYKTSEPLRNKLILADMQLKDYKQRKLENEKRLRELEEKLLQLRDLHSQKEDEVKLFQKEIEEVFILKSKSARLLNELAGEKQKWMVCEDVATQNISNLEGDSLISAAMVCFLAPFTQKTRDYLYTKWLIKIADHRINITRKLNFNSMFSDPLKIKGWLDNGLPNDSYSIQNAIILKNTQMQPILIDPQTQANKWLRNELKEVKILNMQTSRFLQELKFCIKLGNTVLIENVDETISSKLYPLFQFEKLKQSGSRKIGMQIMMDATVTTIDPAFKMYITSVHKNPDFGADLSLLANFINFSVTIEAFEAQILALILTELETEQDAKQKIYRRQALVWIKRLKTIEDEILEELKKDQPQEMLIKREFLIEKLMESRTVTKQTGKTLMEINNSMKLLMQTSKLYKPVSQRAAKFFFVANDLVKLNNMYQFTHEWFISFFSELVGRTLIDDNTQKKKEEAIRRMQANFVRVFFQQVCQTLFDGDKLLFSFLLAYKELEVEFKIDRRQVEFFIKGALQQEDDIFNPKAQFDENVDMDKLKEKQKLDEEVAARRQKICPWINSTQWKAIDKLSQIPPFNQQHNNNKESCLSMHIENNPDQWYNYINGDQLLDYTMAHYSTKDEDGNSIHSSDEDEPIKIKDPEDVSNEEGEEEKDGSKKSKSKNGDSKSKPSVESEQSSSIASVSSNELNKSNEDADDDDSPPKIKPKPKKKVKVEGDPTSSNETSNYSSDEDDMDDLTRPGPSRKITSKIIRRVNTQRFLDLGVPGGYEKFNYEDAIRRGMVSLQMEQEVKERIREGLRKLVMQGQPTEKTREQKILDDIFANDIDESGEDSDDGDQSKVVSRNSNSSEDSGGDSKIENVEDAFEDFRKNNIEEDTRIALAIIQGIAEYAEFKVQKTKHLTKRQMMKQYVINSHMVRLCIMRCFHPEKLYHEVKSFISYFLGRNFTEQPPFEFTRIYSQTKKTEAILLMVGPNVNAYTELSNLKQIQVATQETQLEYQPLGQIPNEKIAKIIIKSACEGNWLLLDNLQLSLEIIANLQKFIETMNSMSKQIKKQLMSRAKSDMKEILVKKQIKEQDTMNNDQDSNIAMELMLLEQSIQHDTLDSTFNPHKNDFSVSDHVVNNDKSHSVSVNLQSKIKYMMRRKKQDHRLEILKELDEYERAKKSADDKSEIRELTNEEKSLNDMVFPENLAFPIHQKFRLWISVIPVPNFPANFARRCLKISLELPVNIRPNTIKSFSSLPPQDVSNVTKNQREFKRMLFSMTVMHAVINHRERFGSFGWTQPYAFSPNDLQISIKMLAEICQKIKPGQNFPLKLMRYLVSDLNYGGKLTNKEDTNILRTQVKAFINMRVFEDATQGNRSKYSRAYSMLDEHQPGQLYDLTGCQADPLRERNVMGDRAYVVDDGMRIRSYMMPVNVDNLRSMREHVRDNFPLEDMPEIFGLHHNATIKATTDIASAIMNRTYIYQFVIKRPKQPALTQVQTNRRNTQIYEYFRQKLQELLFQIPQMIKPEEYEEQIPIEREKPFNTLLTKEIQRYNLLISNIRSNLDSTIAAMEGLRQHSHETELTFEALQQEQVPYYWKANCYPCHRNIQKFIENLNERIAYIRQLLELASNDSFTVRKFWMPGFFNQRNFLTTLMQEVARKQRISIEQLTINFRIMADNEKMFSQIKAEGTNSYYIYGLWLFGAQWDHEEQSILDSEKYAPIGNPLPMLHLMIEKQALPEPNSSQEEGDLQLDCLSTEEYQRQQFRHTHYLCPMFVNFQQNRLDNQLNAEGQMITTVPIPVKLRKPKFWVLRNTCILCYNEEAKE